MVTAVAQRPPATTPAADDPQRPGPAAVALCRQHPPRPVATTWPATTWRRQEVIERLLRPPFAPADTPSGTARRRDLISLLDWLASWPGENWQDRWTASGADVGPNNAWRHSAIGWLRSAGRARQDPQGDFIGLGHALRSVISADVVRPGLRWLITPEMPRNLTAELAATRDPDGFAALVAADAANTATKSTALRRVGAIVAAKGGTVRDVTVGDCVELLDLLSVERRRDTSAYFYQLLNTIGVFPHGAPQTARALATMGQLPVEQLIDQYHLDCVAVRDVLVDYLSERQAALDYTSLRNIAFALGKLFWKDLERHHPGIDSLHLTAEVASAWKRRAATKQTPVGPATAAPAQRADGGLGHLATVRAFYLDIAQWAAHDPTRWGPWTAPCPIRAEEMSRKKDRHRRKSRMDQRTRERLPVLSVLSATVDRQRQQAAQRLAVTAAASPGETFDVAGETLRRSALRASTSAATIWAEDPDSGTRRDVALEEHRAFWTWAAVEVLRHSGIRIEELTELSYHSLVSYRLPASAELVPLLQIAPSKSDAERLLVISPELSEVLAAIVARVRDTTGAVPLVVSYDIYERVWNPPMPLLFQRPFGVEHRPITAHGIRALLAAALAGTGLSDASGRPLRFAPHDFRRIFVTDALTSGLPPHIAQVICGHQDINTTMGYNTVYPEEIIGAHRAFLARRRATRPSEEYRVPTDAEWDEFLGHFERRTVAYGTCARAYATPCIHEHACLRCPMLWPDPAQRPRLAETIDNLRARIVEARREGWLGEVEGLEVSLAGAEGKLAQIDKRAVRRTVDLAMPTRRRSPTSGQAR